MSLPKITVITPSFNQGEFLEETLHSVFAQRYPSLEYIVIDGGSKDDSPEIIARYQDHLAYWVSEKDSGQTNAINKGLARATGDIVAILNSDDVYLPGALDFVAEQFGQDPSLEWMTAPSLYFGEDKRLAREEIMRPHVPNWLGGWLVRQTVPHPSTFIKRSLHEKHGPFNEGFFFGMDYEYWCRLAFGGAKLRAFGRPLSGYRMHGLSKSVSAKDRQVQDKQTIFDTYAQHLSPQDRQRVLKKLKSVRAMESLTPHLDLLRAGDREGAARAWRETIASHPEYRFTRWYFTTWLRIALNKP